MKIQRIVAALVLASGVGLVQAADSPLYAQVGYSMLQIKDGNFKADVNQLAAVVGYDVTKEVAVEGLLSMGLSDNEFSPGFSLKIKNMYGIFVKGNAKINNEFSVHGRLGYTNADIGITAKNGGISGSSSETLSGLAYGFGASYAISKELSVNADYNFYGREGKNGSASSFDGLTFGVGYKF